MKVSALLATCLLLVCLVGCASKADLEDAYNRGYETGYETGHEEAMAEAAEEAEEELSPAEWYGRGYVAYVEGKNRYHLPKCKYQGSGWEWVPEKYAIVRGATFCPRCMPGKK